MIGSKYFVCLLCKCTQCRYKHPSPIFGLQHLVVSHKPLIGSCTAALQSEPDSRSIAGVELEAAKPACKLSPQPSTNQVGPEELHGHACMEPLCGVVSCCPLNKRERKDHAVRHDWKKLIVNPSFLLLFPPILSCSMHASSPGRVHHEPSKSE